MLNFPGQVCPTRRCCLVVALLLLSICEFPFVASGETVSLNSLSLLPPSDTANRLNITADAGRFGNDSDTADLTGNLIASLDVDFSTGAVVPTGLTFHGGLVSASDLSLNLAWGLVTAETSGLVGVPSTFNLIGEVTGWSFPATEHFLLLNQGTVEAAGSTIDLSVEPLSVSGQGTGSIVLAQIGPQVGSKLTYKIEINLPASVSQTITADNIPIVGSVNILLTGGGNLVASQQFTASLPAVLGDFNADGQLNAPDVDALTMAITDVSTDSLFDLSGDGTVTRADLAIWIMTLKGTLFGDANLDFLVDDEDFAIWSSNAFSTDSRWSLGNFNADSVIDIRDFNFWNQFKSISSGLELLSVPEPDMLYLLMTAAVPMVWIRRSGSWFPVDLV